MMIKESMPIKSHLKKAMQWIMIGWFVAFAGVMIKFANDVKKDLRDDSPSVNLALYESV